MVSSNFLPADGSFRALLAASFAVMQHECSDAHAQICQTLAAYSVRLTIDGEIVDLMFTGEEILFTAHQEKPAVIFEATKETLLGLADAKFTLEHAIMSDIIHVRGSMTLLIAFYDALRLYISGGVRCPSFPALLNDYRHRNRV